jgi:adenylate kinase
MGVRLLIMGPPGGGKGTQAKRIAETWGIPHISTGDIFRWHIRENTTLGQKVESYIREGKLVPDDLACQCVAQRLLEHDCDHGYILDGFPRTLAQAKCLEKILAERGEGITAVIHLEVDDDEIVERLAARRVCPRCGAIYNLRFNPPKEDQVCDNPSCEKTPLIQRVDDKEETVRERLRSYHTCNAPILDFYQRLGKLRRVVAGTHDADVIFNRIREVIAAEETVSMK